MMSPGRKIELAAPTSHASAESQPVVESITVKDNEDGGKVSSPE